MITLIDTWVAGHWNAHWQLELRRIPLNFRQASFRESFLASNFHPLKKKAGLYDNHPNLLSRARQCLVPGYFSIQEPHFATIQSSQRNQHFAFCRPICIHLSRRKGAQDHTRISKVRALISFFSCIVSSSTDSNWKMRWFNSEISSLPTLLPTIKTRHYIILLRFVNFLLSL